jgi:tape measure domain-containing protein
MADKVQDAYVDVAFKYNRAASSAALAAVNRDLGLAAAKASRTVASATPLMNKYANTVQKAMGRQPTQQFANNINAVSRNLAQFTAQQGKATKATATAAKTHQSFQKTLSKTAESIGLASYQTQFLGSTMTAAFTAPIAAATALASVIGFKLARQLDSAQVGLKALLPAGYNVEALFKRMSAFAIKSPVFNIGDLTDFTRKLVGAGAEIGQVEQLMKSLNNIFSTYGVTVDGAGLALKGIQQVFQKGRLYAEEMNQQIGEQIPIWNLLSEATGKSQKQLVQDVKEGAFTVQQFSDALIKVGQNEKYMKGAAAAANTLGGTLDRLREAAIQKLGEAFLANKAKIIPIFDDLSDVVGKLIQKFIELLPGALKFFDSIIHAADNLLQRYQNLAPWQQKVIQGFIGLLAVAGPVILIFSKITSGIGGLIAMAGLLSKASGAMKTFSAGVGGIGGAASKAAAGLKSMFLTAVSPAGIAFLGAAIAIGAIAYAIHKSGEAGRKRTADMKAFQESLKNASQTAQELQGSLSAMDAQSLVQQVKGDENLSQLAAQLQKAGLGYKSLIETLKGVPSATIAAAHSYQSEIVVHQQRIDTLKAELAEEQRGQNFDRARSEATTQRVRDLQGQIASEEALRNKLVDQRMAVLQNTSSIQQAAREALAGAGANGTLRDKLVAVANGATDAASSFSELKDKADQLTSSSVDLSEATENQAKSLFNLKDQLKDTAKAGFGTNSAAALKNRDALEDAAKAIRDRYLADVASNGPTKAATDRYNRQKEELIKLASKTAGQRDEVKKLIDKYGAVPKEVKTHMEVTGQDKVNKNLDNMLAKQQALQKGIPISEAQSALRKQGLKFATGGYVSGPGTGTSDSINAKLSNGEFVMRAAAVKKLGVGTLNRLNQADQTPGFASGGLVQTWPFDVNTKGTKLDQAWVDAWKMATGLFAGDNTPSASAIIRMAKSFGIPFSVTSTTRAPGALGYNGDYHQQGKAVDFVSPNMAKLAAAFYKYSGSLLEEIHSGGSGYFVKNGKRVGRDYYGAEVAKHYDHVHIAATAAAIDNALGGGGGGGFSASGGVARWSGTVGSVLRELGQYSSSNVQKVLASISQESGGNPRAVQGEIGDINNITGDLARGLNQVIGATFRAYAGKYGNRGQFDPYANIYASVRYAMSRYGGNWANVMAAPGGYATGTGGAQRGWAWVGERGPELVNFHGGEQVMSNGQSMRVTRGYANGTYKVQRGDTLTGIAHRFGTSVNALVNLNKIANRNLIYTGQMLRISGAAAKGNTPHQKKTTARERKFRQQEALRRKIAANTAKQAATKLATSTRVKGLSKQANIVTKALEDRAQYAGDLAGKYRGFVGLGNISEDISKSVKPGTTNAHAAGILSSGGKLTAGSIIQQLKGKAKQAQAFQKGVLKLKTLGASSALIQAVSALDVDSVTAAALFGANRGQVASLNSILSTGVSNAFGSSLGNAAYGSPASLQAKLKKLNAQIAAAQKKGSKSLGSLKKQKLSLQAQLRKVSNTPVKLFDTGGVLPPGATTVVNATGKSEYIFRPDQVQALQGEGGDTIVQVQIGNETITQVATKVFKSELSKQARKFNGR